MGIQNYKLEQPKDWQEFERLCHCLWTEILKDQDTLMHGRQGQKQAGVDIFGNHFATGKLYGIQCKGKDAHYGKQVTENELRSEVEKALTFAPQYPQVFILATTAPRDRNIQKIAREITDELRATSKMKILVMSWEDICDRIASYPKVIDEFYPHYSSIGQQLKYDIGEIKESVSELKSFIIKNPEAAGKLYDIIQVRKYFTESSNGLLNWPRTLHSNDAWIERPEELDVAIRFDTELHSSSIVLGEPGTGKSALLSKIAQTLTDEGEMVLAIKADQLDNSIIDFKTLGLALGLPGPVDECLKIASKFGSVFLVIDQLDTLSDLIDVKTYRLSVLLNLIRQMSFEPNVHILASSRPFEFNYDNRLSSIKAIQIKLHVLKWEVAEQILTSSGIYIKNADEGFRNFLCKPSNLNFYLSYLKSNPQKYFQSHIELYEDIWSSSLGKGSDKLRRSAFLSQIASVMTNDAKQALPIVRYEQYVEDIDWLVEAGILVKNVNKKSFSFAHQTLQAFVWTRSFIKQGASLKDFVIEHQNNLNVRPRLSTVLFYMREVDFDEYNAQITSVLSTNIAEIRRHIVHLLIECIGVHHDPNQHEIKLLKTLSGDNYYKARVCKAISGKALWFESFKDDILPELMQGDASSKFVATFILSSVLPDKVDSVFELIDKYWRNNDSINYIFYVLRGAGAWNIQMLEQAKRLVSNPVVSNNVPGAIYRHVLQKSPEMGLELSAHHFSNKLKFLIEAPVPEPPSLSVEASEVEQFMHNRKHDPQAKFERLFNFGTAWHNLPEVSQKVPDVFINQFWDYFLLACEHTKYNRTWETNAYEECSRLLFHLSDDNRNSSEAYFSISLEKAIKLYARNATAEFLSLYTDAKGNQLLPVQRILMKGLCEATSLMPDFVLAELMADRRRLKLGSSVEDHYSGTREIISVLSKYLTESKLRVLEEYILSYNQKPLTDDRSVESRKYDLSYNRRVRYQLLSAIDIERRSYNVKKMMVEEERALGKEIKRSFNGGYSGLVSQVSPMNEEQLQKAKDDDIVKCFQEFPDHHDNWRGNGSSYKGSTELGRTFEKFAGKSPARTIAIIKRLKSANKLSVGHGLIGLSKSIISLPELLDLLSSLENEFSSVDFYEDAARAINNKLSMTATLDHEWLKKIENWLQIDPKPKQNPDSNEGDQEENERKISGILWGHGGHYTISSRNYYILECLTLGHLQRNKPLTTEWSDAMVNYINRGDSIDIWLTFLAVRFPEVLGHCKADDVEQIIGAILEKYPTVVSRTEVAYSLAECVKKVSDDKLFAWLDLLVIENTTQSRQMYGELLGIKWIIKSESIEVNTRIGALVDNNDTPALCGLGFTLKNIWKYRKELITDLYVQLVNLQNKDLSAVLLGLLHDNELDPSDELNKIIDAFISNKTLELVDEPDSFIVHCILPLTAAEPLRVSQLCEGILSAHGRSLGDISTAASVGTSDLITIAITLHNLGPAFQKVGLDIFERLMDIDAYQIQEALSKIDSIPQITVAA